MECPALADSYKQFPTPEDFGPIKNPKDDILQGRAYGVAYLDARDQHNRLIGAVETRERICNELGESLDELSKQIDVIIETLGKEDKKK